MQEKLFVTPEYTTAEEIKRVRKQLGLTQKEFAQLVNCSKPTIERWERSVNQIDGPIAMLINLIDNNMEYINEKEIPHKNTPLRLYYMKKNILCTLIDVDDTKQMVKIKNFTDNLMFRAFGKNETPNYKDYEEFLKSRCFPETRDKLKLVLADLDLPFYDPFLIIQKTEGRMAEDDFWIKIEV